MTKEVRSMVEYVKKHHGAEKCKVHGNGNMTKVYQEGKKIRVDEYDSGDCLYTYYYL